MLFFVGKRNDVNKIYSASDVYLMPSISEGLSVALCEAQANGLKCFVSDGVDKKTDISGNVEFISLKEDEKYWAKSIFNNSSRDYNVLDKIKDEYSLKKSCETMYLYYEKILNIC